MGLTIALANLAVGVAIVDGLEWAMRCDWIPQLYTSHVIMAALFGMALLNLAGAHFDRSDT